MGNTESNAVLRRKAREGRQEHQARAMTPEKALRAALAKAADEVFGLGAAVSGVEATQPNRADLLAEFRADDMLLLLEGRGGTVGVLTIGAALVAGLIEQQTIGMVSRRPAAERRPTRLDAAMAAPLVDRLLSRFAALLADEKEGVWAEGYRFGAMVEEVRALDLALEGTEFHRFRLRVDLADGAKSGEMALILPDRTRALPADDAGDNATEPPALGTAVMQAPADLMAVLTRISLPYDALRQIEVGQVLPIPADALKRAMLEAGQGHRVAPVVLGHLNGFRAVRLRSPERQAHLSESMEALPDPALSATVVEEKTRRPALTDGENKLARAEQRPLDQDPASVATAGLPVSDDVPDLGEIAGSDDFADLGDLPALEDLPDLGDLPELDDLPDLNS